MLERPEGGERQGDASTIIAVHYRVALVPDLPLPLSQPEVVDPLPAHLGDEVRRTSTASGLDASIQSNLVEGKFLELRLETEY
jgi:hypothetical protein